MLSLIRKKLGHINGRKLVITGIKLAFASSIMGIVVYWLYMWVVSIVSAGFIGDVIILAITGAAGMLIYYVVIRVLKIEEVDWIIRKLKVRFVNS